MADRVVGGPRFCYRGAWGIKVADGTCPLRDQGRLEVGLEPLSLFPADPGEVPQTSSPSVSGQYHWAVLERLQCWSPANCAGLPPLPLPWAGGRAAGSIPRSFCMANRNQQTPTQSSVLWTQRQLSIMEALGLLSESVHPPLLHYSFSSRGSFPHSHMVKEYDYPQTLFTCPGSSPYKTAHFPCSLLCWVLF